MRLDLCGSVGRKSLAKRKGWLFPSWRSILVKERQKRPNSPGPLFRFKPSPTSLPYTFIGLFSSHSSPKFTNWIRGTLRPELKTGLRYKQPQPISGGIKPGSSNGFGASRGIHHCRGFLSWINYWGVFVEGSLFIYGVGNNVSPVKLVFLFPHPDWAFPGSLLSANVKAHSHKQRRHS